MKEEKKAIKYSNFKSFCIIIIIIIIQRWLINKRSYKFKVK